MLIRVIKSRSVSKPPHTCSSSEANLAAVLSWNIRDDCLGIISALEKMAYVALHTSLFPKQSRRDRTANYWVTLLLYMVLCSSIDPLWGVQVIPCLISFRSTRPSLGIVLESTLETSSSALSEAQNKTPPPTTRLIQHFNTVWSNSFPQFVDTLVDISRTA